MHLAEQEPILGAFQGLGCPIRRANVSGFSGEQPRSTDASGHWMRPNTLVQRDASTRLFVRCKRWDEVALGSTITWVAWFVVVKSILLVGADRDTQRAARWFDPSAREALEAGRMSRPASSSIAVRQLGAEHLRLKKKGSGAVRLTGGHPQPPDISTARNGVKGSSLALGAPTAATSQTAGLAPEVTANHASTKYVLQRAQTNEETSHAAFCNSRKNLIEARAKLINYVRGQLRTRAIVIRGRATDAFPAVVRQLLVEHCDGLPLHLDRVLQTIEGLNDQLDALDHELLAVAKQDPVCQRLMTVPGVGPVIAVRFVAVVDEPDRFVSAHHLMSYLGLTPGENSSSMRVQRTGITKAGVSDLRSALIQGAWSMMRIKGSDPMMLWAAALAHATQSLCGGHRARAQAYRRAVGHLDLRHHISADQARSGDLRKRGVRDVDYQTLSAVTWQSESCPKGLTAVTLVWAGVACATRAPRASDCGIPTDPPSCVTTNADSRLRQLAAHLLTAEYTVETHARAEQDRATPLSILDERATS